MDNKRDRILSRVVARAWLENDYRESLIANPKESLKKAGLTVAGITLVTITLVQTGVPEATMKGRILEILIPPAPVEIFEYNIMPSLDTSEFPLLCFCIRICSC